MHCTRHAIGREAGLTSGFDDQICRPCADNAAAGSQPAPTKAVHAQRPCTALDGNVRPEKPRSARWPCTYAHDDRHHDGDGENAEEELAFHMREVAEQTLRDLA